MTCAFLSALALFALAVPAHADVPAGFDARVEAVRAASGTPGMAIAIDAEGKVARITAKPVSPIADFSFDCRDLAFEPERAGS